MGVRAGRFPLTSGVNRYVTGLGFWVLVMELSCMGHMVPECHLSPSSTHHGRTPHRHCAGFPSYSEPHVKVGRNLGSCAFGAWVCWGYSRAQVLSNLARVGSLIHHILLSFQEVKGEAHSLPCFG